MVIDRIANNDRTIVAGDFNIIDRPLFAFYNWLMGASFFESVPWYSERNNMEEAFSRANFYNPLAGKKTILLLKNQTDHILTPKGSRVLSARVSENSFGSDHYPVMAEIIIEG